MLKIPVSEKTETFVPERGQLTNFSVAVGCNERDPVHLCREEIAIKSALHQLGI